MCYVGNNWFRWRGLRRVLSAVEPVRREVGRMVLVGHGWDSPAPWAGAGVTRDAWSFDTAMLSRLDVEVLPPVAFHEVVPWMGRGVFSPVVYRPLFDHLGLVTCRTFETPAAATIPLFLQAPEFVEQTYGSEALELVLPPDRPEDKILDLIRRPARYAPVVRGLRRRLRDSHSYAARIRQLVAIAED
jgi:hypothetical protein